MASEVDGAMADDDYERLRRRLADEDVQRAAHVAYRVRCVRQEGRHFLGILAEAVERERRYVVDAVVALLLWSRS
jgi:hypothetical protein